MLALTAALLPAEGYSTLSRDPISWAASAKRSLTAFVRGQATAGERRRELLGKAVCCNASGRINPARTPKPERNIGHPFHLMQSASQIPQASCRSLLWKSGKLSAIEWEQEGTGLTPDPVSWAYSAKPPHQRKKFRCTITNRKTSLDTRLLDTTYHLLHTASRI